MEKKFLKMKILKRKSILLKKSVIFITNTKDKVFDRFFEP